MSFAYIILLVSFIVMTANWFYAYRKWQHYFNLWMDCQYGAERKRVR